jgi:simple sugar transport system permease protein
MPSNFLNLGGGYVAQVPIPILLLVGGAIVTAIFVNRTGIGLRIRLVGANETAAHYSGLNPPRVLYATYIASGLLSAVAGIVITARAASASADYGTSYLLLAIVIVVLGGVSPLGGFGTVVGVLLSALVLQMVSTGFNMVGFNAFAYQIAQGLILIVVIGVNTLGQRYRGAVRSRLSPLLRRRGEPEPELAP